MTNQEIEILIRTLSARFADNMRRHEGVSWSDVRARLEANPAALQSLHVMEATGGAPDIVGVEAGTGRFVVFDCSAESPAGRRSLCYDAAALDLRKANKPRGGAVEAAAEMGVELLTEEEYRALQRLGAFDLKTSSWIATPPDVRALGGALFCDRRFGRVFAYHNGAASYFAARGFRGSLRF